MELRDLQAFGEPGAMVYLADCMDLMKIIPPGSVDLVFADPPYRLSTGGVTVKSGRLAPVYKGEWDRSLGFAEDHRFNVRWLKAACRILKPDGTIWVTGTHHIIFSLGFALQTMRCKIINQITWAKPDPPPNALHTAFTHLKAVEVTPPVLPPRTREVEYQEVALTSKFCYLECKRSGGECGERRWRYGGASLAFYSWWQACRRGHTNSRVISATWFLQEAANQTV